MQWGEKARFLEALAQRGQKVPALDERPALPEYLSCALTCYTDLVREGEVRWFEFIRWCEQYGVEDHEYLWGVINKAREAVDRWHSSKKSQASQPLRGQPSTAPPAARR